MFRRKLIIIISGLIFLLLIPSVSFLRKIYAVPILMYHSINPVPNPPVKALIVSPQTFERQMRFLKLNRYNVLPLEELADLIRQKKKIPPRTLAITIDDGYKDSYEYAFKILKKYNLPATIFVIVNEVGREQNDRINWEDIKEMRDSGLITFGSHAIGPDPLTKISSEVALREQIFDSKKIIEEKLGEKVNIFGYPEGVFTSHIRKLVIDAGYTLAAATTPGIKIPNDDLFALKRVRISESANNLISFWFKTLGFSVYLKERRLAK